MECNIVPEPKKTDESVVVDQSETAIESSNLNSTVTRHDSDIPWDANDGTAKEGVRQSDEESAANCSKFDSLQSRTCPKQAENAWRVSSRSKHQSHNGSIPSCSNENECIIPGGMKSISLTAIMAEQECESNDRQASNTKKNRVKFCEEDEDERIMRLSIEASLRDQQQKQDTFDVHPTSRKIEASISKEPHVDSNASSVNGNQVAFSNRITSIISEDDDFDEDMKTAIALSLQETVGSRVQSYAQAYEGKTVDYNNNPDKPNENVLENTFVTANSQPFTIVAPFASDAASSSDTKACQDESEKLARTLHIAELVEYNSYQSAKAAAEAASFHLAMMLQKEEDELQLNNLADKQFSEAARVKREEMCHGGGRGGGGADTGVRTVGHEEFHKMKNANNICFDGRLRDRRKDEEKGMGKLLRSNIQFHNVITPAIEPYIAENQVMGENHFEEYEDEGILMKSPSWRGSLSCEMSSTAFKRLDKGACTHSRKKEAYSRDSTSVSDYASNSFLRSEARQSGMKKGVAKQGHGRAENMNTGRTRGGAMDGAVRLQIAAAINQGLIDKCNGVVKEGKEALVYHAEAGSRVSTKISVEGEYIDLSSDGGEVGSDGYDVAVKVFKRISEFKGRGTYVDGDPRFHRQKFKTNNRREQVVLWAEKEYRNLIRAHRAGVLVPFPLRQKENVLFMRFLGDNGWPSPQLKEVELKKGSDKWTVLYCQTIAAIRRYFFFLFSNNFCTSCS